MIEGLSNRGMLVAFICLLLAGCGERESVTGEGADTPGPARADLASLPDVHWPRYGGGFEENHYSPLAEINADNVGRLGLAWYYDLPAAPGSGVSGAVEADGVLYFAVGLSVIHAVDATTGKALWQYDPDVPGHAGIKLRAGWGVRGIAYDAGRVFTATLDGRLIAIDAKTGQLMWSAQTVEKDDGRYLTGPPYVMNGKVIIGHGGADYMPVRGYVTAYDAATGEQAWRFYTVPGNPADGFENEAMEMAAKTWNGEWWQWGGGGTAWHAMAYDPEFNRIYIGTGNGAPWNQKIRSPGGGDNLFLCSVVALDADTGAYAWHYQFNPGETWDFNAAMDIELADLVIDGKPRKVLMQAPKNGFYYVIDRTNGAFISAGQIAEVNWATHIDPASGRPVETPDARYPAGKAVLGLPSFWGAHGVEAMSFSPHNGLAYIPTRNKGAIYSDPPDLASWQYRSGMVINSGIGPAPADMTIPPPSGWLQAWDPVAQKEAWRVGLYHTHNGGVLSTAGNLVVHGRSTGELSIYAADSGKKLWSFDAHNGIMSHPISYRIGGRQYITLLVGWRVGTYIGYGPRWNYRTQQRRVLAFALDAEGELPPGGDEVPSLIDVPDLQLDAQKVAAGAALYGAHCAGCHGSGLDAGGAGPDLRRAALPTSLEGLSEVIQKGALRQQGMPAFEDFSDADVEALLHYIRDGARRALAAEQ